MYFFADEFVEIIPYIEKVKNSNYDPSAESKFVRFIIFNHERYASIDIQKCTKISKEFCTYVICTNNEEKEAILNRMIKIINTLDTNRYK